MEARSVPDEGAAVDLKAEPLPEEPGADVSVSEVSGEEAIAPSQIEARRAEPAADIMEEAFPETPEGDDLDEDLSSAIQELMEKMEPEEARLPQEQAPAHESVASKEEYVDLSAELGMEEALKDLAGQWSGKESAESFDEFKDGIGNQLNKEDSETHYNLGIAYMEMELFSEASKEFKIALKDARLELDCYTRLGLCAMAENNPEEAAAYYSKGLKAADRSDEEKKALMYELALAYEASGRDDEALELYREIFAMDPDFREAASKVNSLSFTRPLVPLDDGYIEVELL
ncbi:MAG: tetratricopeptide repeat protein [Deltaproteobacteria bacterium]|nr:tetratricopeptide repeat protein [Deltaproteobacteria bacterium]